MRRSASVDLGGMQSRSRAFLAGGAAAVLALSGCVTEDPNYAAPPQTADEVEAQPVCAYQDGGDYVQLDAVECEDDDPDHDHHGHGLVWIHVPPGSHPVGTRHPAGSTAGTKVPSTAGKGYGGSTVRVPAAGGFGGTGKGGAPVGG